MSREHPRADSRVDGAGRGAAAGRGSGIVDCGVDGGGAVSRLNETTYRNRTIYHGKHPDSVVWESQYENESELRGTAESFEEALRAIDEVRDEEEREPR